MRFFIHKLLTSFLMIILTLTLTFILMKFVPGSPFSDERGLPAEVQRSMEAYWGLNRPIFIQYASYLSSVLTLNFGPSMQYPDLLIGDMIKKRFPISFILGLEALFFSIAVGFFLGALASFKKSAILEKSIFFLTMLLVSLPSFCLAVLLQYFFSVRLEWLPLAHFHSFSHTLLPVLALSTFPIAYITMLTREKMVQTLKMTYVKTAYAKGLHPLQVICKHVLPNSLFPLLGYLGQLSANILVGSFVIEKIFAIPGLGGAFVQSVLARDYTVIMSLTAFYAMILSVTVFISEALAKFISPYKEVYE